MRNMDDYDKYFGTPEDNTTGEENDKGQGFCAAVWILAAIVIMYNIAECIGRG